jgi:hypothetical protein
MRLPRKLGMWGLVAHVITGQKFYRSLVSNAFLDVAPLGPDHIAGITTAFVAEEEYGEKMS